MSSNNNTLATNLSRYNGTCSNCQKYIREETFVPVYRLDTKNAGLIQGFWCLDCVRMNERNKYRNNKASGIDGRTEFHHSLAKSICK